MTRSVFTHNMTQPSMVTSVSTGTRAGEGAEYASVSNATNSTFAKVQSTSAGSGKRHTEASGAQAWDATTYHGLLIILKDPNAPVAASCAAVEECLALNKDNLRGFFEQCFAPLMATVFGYDQTYPGRGGWVNRVAFEVQAGRAGRGGVGLQWYKCFSLDPEISACVCLSVINHFYSCALCTHFTAKYSKNVFSANK